MTSIERETTTDGDTDSLPRGSERADAHPRKTSLLHVIVRTPNAIVVDQDIDSLRVPTATGQVGLRPRCEPCVLAIEAGLIVLRLEGKTFFAGTAGGMLHTNGVSASLLTPLAVMGEDVESVTRQLDALLSASNEELEIRQTLGRLETRILQELQQRDDGTAKSRGGL
jgi:F0F1-type ATP synthase epsilon subunit